MFIYSIKLKNSKPLKFTFAAAISLLVICGIILLSALRTYPNTLNIDGKKYSLEVNGEDDCIKFLEQFGYTADELYDARSIVLPPEFEGVYIDYNDLQKSQGFDLGSCLGEKAEQYTYSLKDSSDFATVVACNGKVVAAHLSSMLYGVPLYPLINIDTDTEKTNE